MMIGGATVPHATKASPSEPPQSGLRCACSVSQKDTSFIPVTHSDFFFDLPRAELAYEHPTLRYHGARDYARLPIPDACIPDPPPKALTA
jgi:hypothetical protein